MAKEKLLVSIGMIVYNNAFYLKETLDSLINQTFHNLEIIISDDCSTDNSPKICEEYSKKDNRIKYIHNEENIGEIANINKCFNNPVFGFGLFWSLQTLGKSKSLHKHSKKFINL